MELNSILANEQHIVVQSAGIKNEQARANVIRALGLFLEPRQSALAVQHVLVSALEGYDLLENDLSCNSLTKNKNAWDERTG